MTASVREAEHTSGPSRRYDSLGRDPFIVDYRTCLLTDPFLVLVISVFYFNNNLINFNNASWSISLCLIVYRDYLDGSIQPTNTLETRLSKQIPHVIQPVSSSPTPEENINNLEKIGQIENKTIPTPLDENEEQLKILTQE